MSYHLHITRVDGKFICVRGDGCREPDVDEAMRSMGEPYLINGKRPLSENPEFGWYCVGPSDYWSVIGSDRTSDKRVIEPLVNRAAEVLRNAGHTVTIKPRSRNPDRR